MSKQTITLKTACEKYLAALKERGQKPSTIGTAERTLALLLAEMGESKEVGKIMTVHVSKFYNSEAVNKLNGKPRAEPSVLQIRRIVRASLVWFHEQGWINSVPLPSSEKRFLESKNSKVESIAQGEVAKQKEGKGSQHREPKHARESLPTNSLAKDDSLENSDQE